MSLVQCLVSRHTYAVLALTDIEKFNETFATNFTDEEVDTIGGVVTQACGHLPEYGEQIELEGIQFKVTSADSRRLVRFRVTVSDEQLEKMENNTENHD